MKEIKKLYYLYSNDDVQFQNNEFIFTKFIQEIKKKKKSKNNDSDEETKIIDKTSQFNKYLNFFEKDIEGDSFFLIYNKGKKQVKLSKFIDFTIRKTDNNQFGIVKFEEIKLFNKVSANDIAKCKYFEKNQSMYEKSNIPPLKIKVDPFVKNKTFNFLCDQTFNFAKSRRSIYIIKEQVLESKLNNKDAKENSEIFKDFNIFYIVNTDLEIESVKIYIDGKTEDYGPLDSFRKKASSLNLYTLQKLRKGYKIKGDLKKKPEAKKVHPENTDAGKEIKTIIEKLSKDGFYKEQESNYKTYFYDNFLAGTIQGFAKEHKHDIDSYIENNIHIYNDSNLVETEDDEDDDEIEQEQYNVSSSAEINKYLSQNVIFYGAPGCGKSNYVKKLLNEDGEMDTKYFKRVLFYPEYSYSDFVGQIVPTFDDKNGRIEYKFNPGPFVEILKSAIEDSDHEYFLVIEEINRGNAPAIFGDIFQLLDRNYNNTETKCESEYHINNSDIEKELNSDDVYIPKNLTILATMNTCDQNVFTLDTAFKRRWRMKRIENEFDNEDEFKNAKFKFGDLEISWAIFRKHVNEEILAHAEDGFNLEDKLLGTHFVNYIDLEDISAFAEKVIMYLWNDVAKFNRNQFFSEKYRTLDQAISAFENGENIFSANSKYLYNYFNSIINDQDEKDFVKENQ